MFTLHYFPCFASLADTLLDLNGIITQKLDLDCLIFSLLQFFLCSFCLVDGVGSTVNNLNGDFKGTSFLFSLSNGLRAMIR